MALFILTTVCMKDKVSIKIYLITNQITNKKYIGQTKRKLSIRWDQHKHVSSFCRYLKHSIQKYGSKNFKIEEIFCCFNKEDALYMESYFIDYYKTLSPNGYNLIKPGIITELSEDTRNRLSTAAEKKWQLPEYRDKTIAAIKASWTDDKKSAHSEKHTLFWKENYMVSRLSGIEDYIENKKRSIIGISKYNGEVLHFKTINDAKRSGYYPDNVLKKEFGESMGYYWFYYDKSKSDSYYVNETLKYIHNFDNTDVAKIKSIDCETLNEQIYTDIHELKNEGLHSVAAVKAVLRGRRKTYHGKHWIKL